jgi:hypothetical protein
MHGADTFTEIERMFDSLVGPTAKSAVLTDVVAYIIR